MLRRLDDRAVTRDVRHRAQRVHLLRARDARHAVHRHCRAAGLGQLLQQLRVLPRVQEADQRLRFLQAAGAIALGRAHLQDDVRTGPDIVRRGRDFAPRLRVRLIGEAGRGARAFLDDYVKAQFLQLDSHVGRGSNASLAGVGLSRYTDLHSWPPIIVPVKDGALLYQQCRAQHRFGESRITPRRRIKKGAPRAPCR